MIKELERYKAALEVAVNHIAAQVTLGHLVGGAKTGAIQIGDRIQAILNPPPETEEAGAEIWASIDTLSGRIWGTGTKEQLEIAVGTSNPRNLIKVIKLTGTYRRPVPRKIERSVSVEADVDHHGDACSAGAGPLTNLNPFHAHPETHGKRGTLTFTWEEEA